MKTLCVFCGSNFGSKPEYELAALNLGQELARRDISLVYGGGRVGLMGAVADAVIKAGGKAIGVIPEFLQMKELAHHDLTELHVVDSMHTRKKMMADLSDGFIAMPGGFGTFEELFEVLTWSQLGMHQKPIGLLNVAGFYDPLIGLVRHSVAEGFVREQNLSLFLDDAAPLGLLDRMRDWQPVAVTKWLEQKAV